MFNDQDPIDKINTQDTMHAMSSYAHRLTFSRSLVYHSLTSF